MKLFTVVLLAVCSITSRNYWVVDPTTFANSGSVHTHVSVTGWVVYARCEDDGDTHVRIVPTLGATSPFFIAECIPSLPCAKPAVGSRVTVKGISRRDPEHNWQEIHPVESLETGG